LKQAGVPGVAPPGVPVTIPLPLAVRDLNIQLKGGDDSLHVDVMAGAVLAVNRNVGIDTGSGNDDLLVLADGAVTIGGNLSVKSDSGDDTVRFFDVSKFANGLMIPPAVDILALVDDTAAAGVQGIQVGRDITISTGNGDDAIGLIGVESVRNVSVHSGLGHGDVLGVSNVRAGRDMNLKWGDDNALNNVTIGRKLDIESGTGDDRFAIDNMTVPVVDVRLGLGKDKLALGAGVIITTSAKIDGGGGKDDIASAIPLGGFSVKSFNGNSVNFGDIVNDVLTALV
jgi:hypothetical protein